MDCPFRLLKLSVKTFNKLRHYHEIVPVLPGVSDIMGGQVLEHEGKTIYNAGIEEGIAVGEERGRREEKFDTARRLRQMGLSDNDIHQDSSSYKPFIVYRYSRLLCLNWLKHCELWYL